MVIKKWDHAQQVHFISRTKLPMLVNEAIIHYLKKISSNNKTKATRMEKSLKVQFTKLRIVRVSQFYQ